MWFTHNFWFNSSRNREKTRVSCSISILVRHITKQIKARASCTLITCYNRNIGIHRKRAKINQYDSGKGQDIFKLKVTDHLKHENCLWKKSQLFNELASGSLFDCLVSWIDQRTRKSALRFLKNCRTFLCDQSKNLSK